MEFTFGKVYKLCSVKRIDRLFSEGKRLKTYPVTVMFQETEEEMEHTFQVIFSVPKKRMKHAHDRNYIKRCFREILRINKSVEDAWVVTTDRVGTRPINIPKIVVVKIRL
jgi:ribonuclease P protein component